MPNKLISLLIAICMLFCLSACKTSKTSEKAETTSSELKSDITQNTDETTQIEPENNEVSSSNIEIPKEDDNTQTTSPAIQSKPTDTSSQQTHTHSYSNPTCTSPKKCKTCGETTGSALGHDFSSATCTSPKKCKTCGETTGTALGHDFSSATCTSPKKCKSCGTTEGNVLSHKYIDGKCESCGATDKNYANSAAGKINNLKNEREILVDKLRKSAFNFLNLLTAINQEKDRRELIVEEAESKYKYGHISGDEYRSTLMDHLSFLNKSDSLIMRTESLANKFDPYIPEEMGYNNGKKYEGLDIDALTEEFESIEKEMDTLLTQIKNIDNEIQSLK